MDYTFKKNVYTMHIWRLSNIMYIHIPMPQICRSFLSFQTADWYINYGGCMVYIRSNTMDSNLISLHGSLTRYVKLRIAHAPGRPGTFSPSRWVSNPDMHHGTCVTHVPWCMPGSLTSGFFWSRWRRKRSRHSWRMRNPKFHVSGKRPMRHMSYLRFCWTMWLNYDNKLRIIDW